MEPTGPTITIIDDDPSVRTAVRRLIRSTGLEAESFASADEYLAAGGSRMPGCLVLDVRMAGMSGLELQRQLAVVGRPIPIVFITGHEDEPSRRAALGAGAVDFLTKPFEDQALLHAVARALAVGEAGGDPAGRPA